MGEVGARLGDVVADLSLADLPARTVTQATTLVADALACGTGAVATPWGQALVRSAEATDQDAGGSRRATLLGSPRPGGLLSAAPTNALLINCLDFDDTLFGHPGGPVVATALGMGELLGASGADLLEAVVVGYEVAGRLSEGAAPSPERRREVWGTGIHLAPAAAAVAAKLLGLASHRCADALALAACAAPVSSVRQAVYGPGGASMAKNNYGAAVASGITAAFHASEGISGPRDVFDHADGYAVLADSDRWRPEHVLDGSDGLHVDGVATKPYSCCRKIHAAIDGALRLMKDHQIPLESIRSIVLRSPTWQTSPAFAVHAPVDMAAAQFSAPYCVAAALHGVTTGPSWFESRTLTDPAILETSSKVVVEPVESPDGQPSWILVKLVADRTHHLEVARPLGDPSNPMSRAALESKFHHLVSPVLGEEVAAQLHETLRDLTALSDLSALSLLLRKRDA